jgi:signal transduction histidine kinase
MYQDLGLKDPQWQDLRRLVDRAAPRTVQFINDCQKVEIFSDSMLENVFANLFDNAIRHGEHMTRISVWCMEAENGIVIIVEDNGAGVPLGLKAKIFDKGFGKHTGFGLFLAREVLAITGISIHETGVHGKGARFEIFVPTGMFRVVSGDQQEGKEAGS